ncbi:MAG: hypothetical protein HY070_11335 [Chloroflexi bacterium]|nr:hypothetical protein [Chloroflexota bacterium]
MQSKSSRAILIALGAILITALVAGAGFFIEQSNGQVKPFIKPDLRASGTKEPHGAAGSIQKIEGQTLYIQTRDGKAQIILIDSETRIEKNQKMIGLSDLKEGDSILVV